jgi:hypothetical protein
MTAEKVYNYDIDVLSQHEGFGGPLITVVRSTVILLSVKARHEMHVAFQLSDTLLLPANLGFHSEKL